MFFKRLYILLVLLLIFFQVISQSSRVYQTVRVTGEPPDIDGLLSEPVWATARWSGDFIQREPYENQPPSQQTAFKILYDDNNLYIAVRAYDTDPEKIERRLTTDRLVADIQVPKDYDFIRDQSIRRLSFNLTPPNMEDQTDDVSRLKTVLRRKFGYKKQRSDS